MFIEICLVFWYFGCIFYEKSCLMFIRSYRNKFDVEENIELKKRNNSFLFVCNKKVMLLRVNVFRDYKLILFRGIYL